MVRCHSGNYCIWGENWSCKQKVSYFQPSALSIARLGSFYVLYYVPGVPGSGERMQNAIPNLIPTCWHPQPWETPMWKAAKDVLLACVVLPLVGKGGWMYAYGVLHLLIRL